MLRDFPVPPLRGTLPAPEPSSRAVTAAEPPATPRPSASVLLVRDSIRGVDVFTFRRRRSMAFAPSMVVYPGGAVEAEDAALATGDLTVLQVAAVRETFEECGVLLAVPDPAPEPHSRDRDDRVAHLGSLRAELLAGRSGLAEVLQRARMSLDPALLHAWARWVTPTFERRRFDTTFFVARLPVGQQPGEIGGEGEDAGWLTAARGVAEHRAGRLPLLPPTLVCLEDVAAAGSVEELLTTQRVVRPVCPWLVELHGSAAGADGAARWAVQVDLDGRGGGERREGAR